MHGIVVDALDNKAYFMMVYDNGLRTELGYAGFTITDNDLGVELFNSYIEELLLAETDFPAKAEH